MATYKVIQDVEAEDKLVGPLSLRQFIYAIITIALGFITYQLMRVHILVGLPVILPTILFGFLAAPLTRDQPSEIWLLSRIRFFLKPRKRIWDQSGLKELVTITVPKKVEVQYTNNLSQHEVRSRLKALANTIDSRGWAIKNVNVNLFAQPGYAMAGTSDRLIDPSSIPQDVPMADIQAADDMMDTQNNPVAQHLSQMVTASTQTHRQQAITNMQQASQGGQDDDSPNNYWFMNEPAPASSAPSGYAVFDDSTVVAPGVTPQTSVQNLSPEEEARLLKKIHPDKGHPSASFGHLKNIKPLPEQSHETKAQTPPQSVTGTPDPAILKLARNNDFNVATIAREAQKATDKSSPDDEVVVSLR